MEGGEGMDGMEGMEGMHTFTSTKEQIHFFQCLFVF